MSLSRQIFPWPPSCGDRWKHSTQPWEPWPGLAPEQHSSEKLSWTDEASTDLSSSSASCISNCNASCSPALLCEGATSMLLEGELLEEGPCLYWYFCSPQFLPPRPWIWWSPFKTRKNGQVRIHHVSLKISSDPAPRQGLLKGPYDKTHAKWERAFSDLPRTLIWPLPSSQPLPRSQRCPLKKGFIYSFCRLGGTMLGTGGAI